MPESQGEIEHPQDNTQAASGGGFLSGVTDFFDGLGDVTNSIQGITNTGSAIAQDIADAREAIDTANHNEESQDQELFLEKFKVLRGDNQQMIWAMAAAAVALVVVFK